MLWPESRQSDPLDLLPPSGYRLRTYIDADASGYLSVMTNAGFTYVNDEFIDTWKRRVLPDGWFLIEHIATGDLVCTAMATHNPEPLHPYAGELGWVAGSSAHAGKGLGMAVCAAVLRRFRAAGYRRVYLKTDDWRLPAIKSYLKLGFVPFLYAPDMPERWQVVCEQLDWPALVLGS